MLELSLLESVIALMGVAIPAIAGMMTVKWQQAKNQIKDVKMKGDILQVKSNQIMRLLNTLSDALEDDKITVPESKLIARQIKAMVEGMTYDDNP